MDNPIRQIAQRLKGLREVLELTEQEVARAAEITVDDYRAMENAETDLSVAVLQKISNQYGIPLDVLMFGKEPRMNQYFLTRAHTGVSIERTKAYKYESLASGFCDRQMEPFIVTVSPKEKPEMTLNTHPGQEFITMLEGDMLIQIGSKTLELHPGDSIYFDSTLPHGMLAKEDKDARFLSVVRR